LDVYGLPNSKMASAGTSDCGMHLRDLHGGAANIHTGIAMRLPQSGFWRPFRPATIPVFLLLLSTGVAAQLNVKPANLHFSKVVSGQTETLSATLTNAGSSSVTISTVNSTASWFAVSNLSLPLTLTPGQSVSFSVTFSPVSNEYASGSITFNTNAVSLGVSGWGVASWSLTANPASMDFGNVPAGSTVTLPITITNGGSTSITVSQELTSAHGFSASGLTLPLTLTAGQSFSFSLSFAPTVAGAATGYFNVSSPGYPVLAVALSGTGTAAGQLSDSPGTMNFGNVTVGQNLSQSGTLTATGANVTVSSASNTNSDFALTGVTLPVTITAGQSLSYAVTFTPQSSGTASGTLTFVSNASNPDLAESLSGDGVASYSVALTWDASTSPVVGYNVYRGGKSGGPYTKLNATLDPNTSYTDSTVTAGQNYYYVTTSVNSSGMESTYSNQTQAVIP
jgi:Abnormal spindle-like microcephaly-assoc'd, ASPM-SPD-2-Hydin